MVIRVFIIIGRFTYTNRDVMFIYLFHLVVVNVRLLSAITITSICVLYDDVLAVVLREIVRQCSQFFCVILQRANV